MASDRNDSMRIWVRSLNESLNVLKIFLESPTLMESCCQFSELIHATITGGGNLFSCGNGGSHCDAMHFAEEWTGRFRKDRRPIGALALGDASHITCVGNDYGFEDIFARQLDGLGRRGDTLICLSTSGNSKNVIRAVEMAKEKGIKSVGLLGRTGGALKDLVDLPIIVPATTSDRIQEIHIKLIHIVIEDVERKIFPELYDKM